ncbi:MAG: hypothetical protein E1N59_392 [Puniceicoccaceae bacterium 5H]|nr:MAG: hypothetical protein E1N59_392 [Puniceicoccaceae bacterium 5H]
MSLAWQVSSATGLFLAGLIWTVHLVLYPLFRLVLPDGWCAYHAQHTRRMGWVVAPAMLAELVATAALCFDSSLPIWLRTSLLTLVAVNWLATGLGAVPLHQQLAQGLDPRVVDRLLKVDRWRVLAWTLKAVLMQAFS